MKKKEIVDPNYRLIQNVGIQLDHEIFTDKTTLEELKKTDIFSHIKGAQQDAAYKELLDELEKFRNESE